MSAKRLAAKPRVLIVDADPASKAWLERIAPRSAWQFKVIRTAECAIQHAMEPDLDIVLIDLALPGLGAYDVYSLIRSHEQSRQALGLPIVAMSEHPRPTERARTLSIGFVGHLAKPFRFEDVERIFFQSRKLGHQLHRNQHSVDRDRIIGRILESTTLHPSAASSILAGMTLALETRCTDLLYRVLLAVYECKADETASYARQLASMARGIGASTLADFCASIVMQAGASSQQIEQLVVLAKAELDRIVFSLREKTFACGTLGAPPIKKNEA